MNSKYIVGQYVTVAGSPDESREYAVTSFKAVADDVLYTVVDQNLEQLENVSQGRLTGLNTFCSAAWTAGRVAPVPKLIMI